MKKEKIKRNKIIGAVLSSIIFGTFFIFFAIIIMLLQLSTESKEQMPWTIFCITELSFLIPVAGIIYNLVLRIKEINGGEEDEASKY